MTSLRTFKTSSNQTEERERLRLYRLRADRARAQALRALSPAAFLSRTMIEAADGSGRVPFVPWPAQVEALATMDRERLILFLKARQLGISWLACGFVLRECATKAGQTWLIFSQSQLEANELTRRIAVMHAAHRDPLPRLVVENKQELVWSNGSRVLSLPATQRAGRTFTASGVVLDEWAFMAWGGQTLAAAKPTIDAGGKLFLISTADGHGTAFHNAWLAAQSGESGFTAVFLPWHARPGRDAAWYAARQREAALTGDPTTVYREYPSTPEEAFAYAAGLVYGDAYHDGETVTPDAEYVADGGQVWWGVDDGYAGVYDPTVGMYTPTSHPRVILWMQVKADGHLDVFDESYAVSTLSDHQIDAALARAWARPAVAVVDRSAAEVKARLHARGIATLNSPASVEESIKEVRRALAADANGWRRVRIHPRCTLLRRELLAYRLGDDGRPVKAHDHGPDALRYLVWALRFGG